MARSASRRRAPGVAPTPAQARSTDVGALDDRALAQQELVGGGKDLLPHVLADLGDQRESLGREEVLGERLGDLAAIAKELAEEATRQSGNRAAVIDVTGGETEREQFTSIIETRCSLNP